MSAFFRKLRWLTERRHKEQELREELQFHLDQETEERQAGGLDGEQAKWAARRDLGNIAALKENTRAAWSWTFLEQLFQDLRYAARTMLNNRTFTLLAALSLALGIGANTAIYSLMDAILLRTLPVSDPASLVVVKWHNKVGHHGTVMHAMSGSWDEDRVHGATAGIFPYPAFELFRKSSDSVFASVFAYYPTRGQNVMVKGQAELGNGEYVSGDYFRGLAVLPAAGRLIVSDDDRAGAPPVVVLSFAYSRRRFGDASSAPGQSMRINNVAFTVAGVTPPEFFGVDPAAAPDFYVPLHANLVLDTMPKWGTKPQTYLDQNYYWVEMMARLRPGIGLAQAQAALAPPFHRWVASTATNSHERATLPDLLLAEGAGGLDNLRRRYSKPLYVLLAMVGLILAIACANIANLLLARATARRREMALRLSLGAGRFRVVRQLLTESVLLASLGGAVGILFAVWGVRFLTILLASGEENLTLHAELNWQVLSAAVGLSLLCGVLFGLVPAIQSTRVDVIPALKEVRSSQTRRRFGVSLSQLLVVFQIALSLLMLVGSGLFVRTLANLQSVELGFNRENILLFDLNARQAGHQDPEITTYYGDLGRRLSALPGVRNVSFSESSLIRSGKSLPITIGGTPVSDATRLLEIGPAFFTTMQVPILFGREIDERDQPGSPLVAVVSELFAKTNFGQENPLGRRITMESRPDMVIVGVSKDAHYGDLRGATPPVVYIPYNQATYPPLSSMTYALRTAGVPLAQVKSVRDIVHQADPRVPVTEVRTQAAEIDQDMNQEITFAKLCSGFAGLALGIACVGLYGTLSYTVARRTSEIGVRMALGAERGRVIWMVLRQVLALAAVGLAISVPAALAASKLVESFLFGIKPNDPLALALAAAILTGAVLLAGFVPARQASRIDPMTALRHE